MPDDVINPYAPPVAAEPAAPADPERLWMVQGDYLLVRDGARIPPVPLVGEGAGELTTSQQVFATASGSSILVALLPLATTLGLMLTISVAFNRVGWVEGIVTYLVASRLLRRFTAGKRSLANIQCHVSVAAGKARASRDRWRGWMMMAAVAGFLLEVFGKGFERAYIYGDDHREHLWAIWVQLPLVLSIVVLYFGSLLWLMMERGLKCVRRTDGWFYLTGVPQSSLARLASMSSAVPPVRPRKLYTLYQHRLSLGLLLGPRRNPLLILAVLIMKITRSPALVRQSFHWSEGRRGVPQEGEIAARIAKLREQPELAAWLDLGCSRLDSPQGDMRVLVAGLASPDRRHFCQTTLVRISKARAYVEVSQTGFRTWTSDGRCLITSAHPSLPLLPGYVEFQRVRGNTARVWSRHLQRCERVAPVAVESDEEFRRLVEKEAEDHGALLEAAGIRGPLVEEDLPGDWEELPVPREVSGFAKFVTTSGDEAD